MLMRRREFITGIGGAAAWSLAAAAQQPRPVVGFVTARSAAASERAVAAFRKGLRETGYVEDRNVIVEYHWLDGQFDQLPALMADLVRRRVAVIASPNNTLITIMAKAKTATIPIVFSVGIDPVKTGLVASFSRPAGNATGIHFFALELTAKRLGLLRVLAPEATRVAILVNPANGPSEDETLRSVGDAARSIGLQTKVLNASASGEIDAAFATLAHERRDEVHPNDMLFVAADGLFQSRSEADIRLTCGANEGEAHATPGWHRVRCRYTVRNDAFLPMSEPPAWPGDRADSAFVPIPAED